MKRVKEHFVTCGQMKILERRADEDGLSYYQMMENAGSRAAESILERMTAGNSSTCDEYDFTGGAALKVAEPNVVAAAFAGSDDESKDESRKFRYFAAKGTMAEMDSLLPENLLKQDMMLQLFL